jgi:hypothetical protein
MDTTRKREQRIKIFMVAGYPVYIYTRATVIPPEAGLAG